VAQQDTVPAGQEPPKAAEVVKGTTDENVVVAHRDDWFEGANDNGTPRPHIRTK
jgi:hypothetical protein